MSDITAARAEAISAQLEALYERLCLEIEESYREDDTTEVAKARFLALLAQAMRLGAIDQHERDTFKLADHGWAVACDVLAAVKP